LSRKACAPRGYLFDVHRLSSLLEVGHHEHERLAGLCRHSEITPASSRYGVISLGDSRPIPETAIVVVQQLDKDLDVDRGS
jgi:hypothetical protein